MAALYEKLIGTASNYLYSYVLIILPVVLSFCYNAGQDEREQDSY